MESYRYNVAQTEARRVLTITTLWANSADDKLGTVFLFFPENRF